MELKKFEEMRESIEEGESSEFLEREGREVAANARGNNEIKKGKYEENKKEKRKLRNKINMAI